MLDPPLIIKQDTKTFPKCYVGRNGKRNSQWIAQDTTESRVPRLNLYTNLSAHVSF